MTRATPAGVGGGPAGAATTRRTTTPFVMRGHPMTDLFLDCEWADVLAGELVSIGLVSLDTSAVFYAERDPLPADPTPWVAAMVYPLLERGAHALTDGAMTRALREFLAAIKRPRLFFDCATDRVLCQRVLDGHDLPRPRDLGAMPRALRWQQLTDTGPALERWWQLQAPAGPPRHHALNDARALRAAWLTLWGL